MSAMPPSAPDRYEVWVSDPFHYDGQQERTRVGGFADCEEARSACRRFLDEFLLANAGALANAEELWTTWEDSGPEPSITCASAAEECRFSAREYVRQRVREIYAAGPPPAAGGQPRRPPD